jgi:hypothetical protein
VSLLAANKLVSIVRRLFQDAVASAERADVCIAADSYLKGKYRYRFIYMLTNFLVLAVAIIYITVLVDVVRFWGIMKRNAILILRIEHGCSKDDSEGGSPVYCSMFHISFFHFRCFHIPSNSTFESTHIQLPLIVFVTNTR